MGSAFGIVSSAGDEHGDEDLEESVDDASDGAPMSVAALSQFGVVLSSSGVDLRGDASEVVGGFSHSMIAGSSLHHVWRFAASASAATDGCDACHSPQRLIVSELQG